MSQVNPETDKIKSMSESEYYYGCSYDTWDEMLYPDALSDRFRRVKIVWEKLYQDERINGRYWTDEQKMRMFKVEKAVKDNQQLQDERGSIL